MTSGLAFMYAVADAVFVAVVAIVAGAMDLIADMAEKKRKDGNRKRILKA